MCPIVAHAEQPVTGERLADVRRRRDTEYHRYGPGSADESAGWPTYPAGSPGAPDPLSATRDADLTGPAAAPSGTRPVDAAPHDPTGAPPSGTDDRSRSGPDPLAAHDDGPPATMWRTARWSVVTGLVVGVVYFGTCTGLGLTREDAAILAPVGLGFLLLLGASLVTGGAWIVRRALAHHRARTVPLSPGLRRWTKVFGVLLGFVIAACVWNATLG